MTGNFQTQAIRNEKTKNKCGICNKTGEALIEKRDAYKKMEDVLDEAWSVSIMSWDAFIEVREAHARGEHDKQKEIRARKVKNLR